METDLDDLKVAEVNGRYNGDDAGDAGVEEEEEEGRVPFRSVLARERLSYRIREMMVEKGSVLGEDGQLIPPPWVPELDDVIAIIKKQEEEEEKKKHIGILAQILLHGAIVLFVFMFTMLVFFPDDDNKPGEAAPMKSAAPVGIGRMKVANAVAVAALVYIPIIW